MLRSSSIFALAACGLLTLAACSSSQNPSQPIVGASGGGTSVGSGGAPGGVDGLGGADGGSGLGVNNTADSLAAKYQSYFPIGVAIAPGHISTVRDIIVSEFNHLTAENDMKFSSLQPSEGNFTYTNADQIAQLARDEGMKITFHTFVWHRQSPDWLFADLTPGDAASIETLKTRLKTHIDTIVPRYADVSDNFDVVNEAISDDGSKTYRDGAEGSKWYDIFGSEDYVYWAFKYTAEALEANQAGSSAGKLYYNDYNVTIKVDKIIAMLDAVRAKGAQVDGIGLQAHVNMDWPSVADYTACIEKIIAAGYKVKISELDVSVYSDYPNGSFEPAPEVAFTAELEQKQAARYQALFELYRKYPNDITSVSVWGVSDDATWLDDEPVAGRDNYPLLFNDAHMPKAALSAIKDF